MKTKYRRRRALAAVLAVVALAALAGLVWLLVLLVRGIGSLGTPDMRAPKDVKAVVLAEDWSSYFSTARTTEEQQAYLESTLDEAAALGANTVLLSGRVDGDPAQVLFRVKGKDLAVSTAAAVTGNDRFLSKFDPVKHLMKQAKERDMQVALIATDDSGQPLTQGGALPQWLEKAAKDYKLALYGLDEASAAAVSAAKAEAEALAAETGEETEPRSTLVTYVDMTEDGKAPALLRKDGDAALLAAAWQLQEGNGMVLGRLGSLLADGDDAAVALRFAGGEALPDVLAKEVPRTLSIISPDPAVTLYSENVYLIGTSDPDQPLSVNGTPVERTGDMGVWGLLVPLNMGANDITAVQGENTVTITVTRSTYSGGGSGAARPDGSVAAAPGQKLRITEPLASLLTDYTNSDSIQMTAYEGAVATVKKSVSFVRSGRRTYAYQLENGGYILAKDCELLDSSTPDAAFTGAGRTTEGNMEVFTLTGSGTPLYTHTWEGNELTLTFLSASFTGEMPADLGFGGATVTVEPTGEGGFSLHFVFNDADPLWGYHVRYTEDGTSQILLKHQPKRSDAETGPLTGVTVMLDPGHGGTDMGAVGSPSEDIPQEKDLNLAEALAAKYRLEQLGATVLMTRSDDTFPSLGDRVKMLNDAAPDFFISVHHNSTLLDKDADELVGTECYWFYTEGKPLAQALVDRVTDATGRQARGVFYNYFYVTRSNICPAVLLETGFVSSPTEYQSCAGDLGLWAEGGAIAQAVLDCVPD
ncbi:MAG TPA: N-acetylmuramoyl-L-alanine amidase [Candidatus Fournierella merdipullorum]|uniref:N-acetylmuramoyl-L-alanine amidase n=1 Tax=Candidatus Allofournierella merdipullorum TaxID=2838595 RepID=A0A9D2E3G5_9FIRM|nr:N-acetylmuramoyl-L-alanine amidase [Candidatus Fournierella merdipullorum]